MKKLFLLFALLALFATPALADRSMAGGYVELVEPVGPLCPCGIYDFVFYVWNGSTDYEWVSDVILTFPDCWEIVIGSDWYTPDAGASGSWNFVFIGAGNIAHWADADGGWGEIDGGEGGLFGISIHVCADAMGEVPIHWFLQGDIYGNEPHFIEGDIFVVVEDITATDDSSWSQLKGLY